jgi:hypothetical protein
LRIQKKPPLCGAVFVGLGEAIRSPKRAFILGNQENPDVWKNCEEWRGIRLLITNFKIESD